jgi:hypothetical protein
MRAFDGCENIVSVINLNPKPQDIDHDVFGIHLQDVTLYIPAESVEAYRSDRVWGFFGTVTAYESKN